MKAETLNQCCDSQLNWNIYEKWDMELDAKDYAMRDYSNPNEKFAGTRSLQPSTSVLLDSPPPKMQTIQPNPGNIKYFDTVRDRNFELYLIPQTLSSESERISTC
jgi:hypothetical protein